MKSAIDHSDGVIIGSPSVNPEVMDYMKRIDKPFLDFQPMDRYIDAFSDFYDEILVAETVSVD